jgi:hypothetical protein
MLDACSTEAGSFVVGVVGCALFIDTLLRSFGLGVNHDSGRSAEQAWKLT